MPPTRDDTSREAPQRSDYFAIFLVSLAVMLFQIAITRVMSVVVWYHFAFFTLSLVMLGLGAPGVWFALQKTPQRWLAPSLLLGALALPGSVVAMLRWGAAARDASPVLLILFVLPATLTLGSAVCLLLMRATGPSVARMYGVDLLGACVGAVLVIPLLETVPTPHLVAGCAALPLLALATYSARTAALSLATGVVIVGFLASGDHLSVRRSKDYDEAQMAPPLYEKWSPIARIAVFGESFFVLQGHPEGFAWGRGDKAPRGQQIRQYWLEQDGSAGTPITNWAGDPASLQHLMFDVTSVGYQLREPERVVVIGAGGGRDILTALHAGASDIEAVELNQFTVAAVSGPFKDFSGDPYHAPGVRAVESEGRSHLTHSAGGYDLIQISLIDSWAASTAGAFALAENNLYTVEAFDLYLDKLAPGGLLSTSRWSSEVARLLALARGSLVRRGVERPEDHLVLVEASMVSTLLVSKSSFTPEDLARLTVIAEQRGFRIAFPETTPSDPPSMVSRLVHGDDQHLRAAGLNLDPPTDDSPYFFHVVSPFARMDEADPDVLAYAGLGQNPQSSRVLQVVMAQVSVFAVGLFLLPLASRATRPEERASLLSLVRGSTYFAAIGAGFMLMETMLVHRCVLYLGHPSYSTTVILAALLLGMGVGSMFAPRVGVARLQGLGILVPPVLAALVLATPSLFHATLAYPLPVRISLVTTVLAPLGAVLGLFFPLGMIRFGDGDRPWFWSMNGVFGVLASVLSLALSMEFGYTVVGIIACALYGVAWVALQRGTFEPGAA